jgi:hypothetical protein
VVNMGSGLGQSFFLAVTLSSGQVEWSTSWAVILLKFTVVSSFEEWSILEVDAGQTFLRADSFSPGYTLFSVRGMAQGGEWSDSYSLGQTHSLQVTLCLVSEEWPRVGNSLGSAIRDSHSLGFIHSLQVHFN